MLPRTLAGQLIAMLIVILLLAQAANLYLTFQDRAIASRSEQIERMMNNVVELASAYRSAPARELPVALRQGPPWGGAYFLSENNRAVLKEKAEADPNLADNLAAKLRENGIEPISVAVSSRPFGGGPPPAYEESSQGSQADDLPQRFRIGEDGLFHPSLPSPSQGSRPRGAEEITLSVELESGIWLNAMVPFTPAEILTQRIIWSTLVLALLASLAAWWVVRRLTQPLAKLARSAEAFGRGGDPEPMELRGPRDVAAAAEAFNKMQERLARQLENQRLMLRAVGHDLRTPLTSLRIRAESIPATNNRDKIIATLDEMQQMVEDILGWSKDVFSVEEPADVDLIAMVNSIVDDYKTQGAQIDFEDTDQRVTLNCRRVGLRRAIRNLIDNALRYAGSAELLVIPEPGQIRITVADRGPGIPEAEQVAVLRPFYRIESSRSKETGGTGLGLSIVQSFLESQGGTLHLRNRTSGGLKASMTLPS